ncbi:hypothetical protein CRUP_018615 [Coryphaenoides rupestris]|nr:hypothetical protein CRUP_018615 [Coryphaenoides rupestris]
MPASLLELLCCDWLFTSLRDTSSMSSVIFLPLEHRVLLLVQHHDDVAGLQSRFLVALPVSWMDIPFNKPVRGDLCAFKETDDRRPNILVRPQQEEQEEEVLESGCYSAWKSL